MDGWRDERTDGEMDGETDGQTDGCFKLKKKSLHVSAKVAIKKCNLHLLIL